MVDMRENARLMREQFQSGKSLDEVQQVGVIVQGEVIENE